MENMEGAESSHNTKISDSGYSNSCSNSQSQRSGSSKSRHSGSSFGSSGYGGKSNTAGATPGGPVTQHPTIKRTKDKDRKKKRIRTSIEGAAPGSNSGAVTDTDQMVTCDGTAGAGSASQPGPGETGSLTTELMQVGGAETDEASQPHRSPAMATCNEPAASDENQTMQSQPQMSDSSNVVEPACPATSGAVSMDEGRVDAEGGEGLEDISKTGCNTPKATKAEQVEDGFCCVISMLDGVVLFTTPSITRSLGFPKDMWLGRSFIDFVHPKDRATFASQITSKVVLPLGDSKGGSNHKDQKNCLYVMLRKYRGLKSAGFGVTKTTVNYEPYCLVLTFREAPNSGEVSSSTGRNILLIVSATPVKSVYTQPNERMHERKLKFSTRHTTNGVLNYVDGNSVESIGYLPQDILGQSIMELYHPEDMPILKEMYETIMVKGQTAGASFVSQPYRFRVKNGCYLVLKTEWISFVNPWSRELEFVIGNHHILEGPSDPDVFALHFNHQHQFADELLKEAKTIEEQILRLLKEPVTKPSDTVKQEVSKRCKALASFMEEMMDEVTQPKLKLNLLNEPDFTFSERDSVMLGEISPHHDYFNSKSSSETPPSYNQLNYNDNLQRFFDSRPVMNIKESQKNDSSGGTSTENQDDRTNVSPNQRFSASGGGGSGGSAENYSSESNAQMDSTTNTTSNTGTSSGSVQPPTLTEELLCQHNEDMQKVMLKRHREARTTGRGADKNRKGPPDKVYTKIAAAHGVKRGSSHSWEDDMHKTAKHQHNPNYMVDYQPQQPSAQPTVLPKPAQPLLPAVPMDTCQSVVTTTAVTMGHQTNTTPYNLPRAGEIWPNFSGSVTTVQTGQTSSSTGFIPSHNIFPTLYYITAAAQPAPTNPALNPMTVPYVAGMMYPHPQLYQQSLLYPPMMYQAIPYQPAPPPCGLASDARNQAKPQPQPQPPKPQAGNPMTSSGQVPTSNTGRPGDGGGGGGGRQVLQTIPPPTGSGSQSQAAVTSFQWPPSQATSVKAEPGSNMAFSESSKKDLDSSPGVSNVDNHFQLDMDHRAKVRPSGGTKMLTVLGNNSDDMDESSFSSFYSSFLKTDNSSECNGVEKGDSSEMIWDRGSQKVVQARRRPNPPWLDNICLTKDLIYQYQMNERSIKDVLEADLIALKSINQPILVNDQLGQLYLDLELEGLSAKLSLSETTSGSSSDSSEPQTRTKMVKRSMRYNKLVMIYEENAPFPPLPLPPMPLTKTATTTAK
uniref:Period circadian protein n=1 Tax=Culex tarsalis TaxID=7177 RepID=A0A1Q3EZL0_CULTA